MNPRSTLLALLLLTAGAEPEPHWPPEVLTSTPAAKLVAASEAYLSEGRLGHAVETAFAAAHRDPSHVGARLVLARALAAVHQRDPERICDWWSTEDEIESQLGVALSLDPDVLERLQTDAAFAELRLVLGNSLWWREVQGARLRRKRDLEPALVATTWWAEPEDRWFTPGRLDLREDGTFELLTWDVDEHGSREAIAAEGTWALERRDVVLQLDGEHRLSLDPNRSLRGDLGVWRDRPADCDAEVRTDEAPEAAPSTDGEPGQG